jgi:hypothetical protein
VSEIYDFPGGLFTGGFQPGLAFSPRFCLREVVAELCSDFRE